MIESSKQGYGYFKEPHKTYLMTVIMPFSTIIKHLWWPLTLKSNLLPNQQASPFYIRQVIVNIIMFTAGVPISFERLWMQVKSMISFFHLSLPTGRPKCILFKSRHTQCNYLDLFHSLYYIQIVPTTANPWVVFERDHYPEQELFPASEGNMHRQDSTSNRSLDSWQH